MGSMRRGSRHTKARTMVRSRANLPGSRRSANARSAFCPSWPSVRRKVAIRWSMISTGTRMRAWRRGAEAVESYCEHTVVARRRDRPPRLGRDRPAATQSLAGQAPGRRNPQGSFSNPVASSLREHGPSRDRARSPAGARPDDQARGPSRRFRRCGEVGDEGA